MLAVLRQGHWSEDLRRRCGGESSRLPMFAVLLRMWNDVESAVSKGLVKVDSNIKDPGLLSLRLT